MDAKSQQLMNAHYSDLLFKHHNSIASLAYKDIAQQEKRFALLAAVEPISKTSSVLDIGCGLAHLYKFLRKFEWEGPYTGIDINSDMIALAKKRVPQGNFICKNILRNKFNEKYDYVFCGAAIQHKPTYVDSSKYLKQMIKKMFSLTKKALAFDIFSSRCDYLDKDKLYVDPCDLLNFCYTLTRRVVLRNDCRPYEITMYLYKDTFKDKFNIYSHWMPPIPRIVK